MLKYLLLLPLTLFAANYDTILSPDKSELIPYIEAFPNHDYTVHHSKGVGYFYIDPIPDAIKDLIRNHQPWEKDIQQKLTALIRPGSIALDIGAHIGTHTLTMSKAVGPSGTVIAFEPQPKIFRELFLNMQLNHASNILFYHAGAGDHIGQIELSPLAPGNEGGTALAGGTGRFVPLLTIDSLNLTNVSLIKIDVEGMEDAVLDGAASTILTNKPTILIEIQGGNNIKTAPQPIRAKIINTIQKLQAFGYKVTPIGYHDYLAVAKTK